MVSPAPVLCFGEVLWDVLPQGRHLGGAPLNVAFHLTQLGCPARIASAVGSDELGRAALDEMRRAGLDTGGVSVRPDRKTGTAAVELDAGGQPKFRLAEGVAWDGIDAEHALAEAPPAAVVFGTLALRSEGNRAALRRILEAFHGSWCVCDLNLRPPFDDLGPLQSFLGRADLLKLNGDEARRLTGRGADAVDWVAMAAELGARHPRAAICITLGGEGAALRIDGRWITASAPTVKVADTIGAGDAFTAALVAGRLASTPPVDWGGILHRACALGSYVASRPGAQPPHGDFRFSP
jgi:fructokinase